MSKYLEEQRRNWCIFLHLQSVFCSTDTEEVYKQITKKHIHTNTHKTKTANTKTVYHSQVDGIPACICKVTGSYLSPKTDYPSEEFVVLFTSSIQMSKQPSNQSTTTSSHTVPNSVFTDLPNTYWLKSELQKATLNKR